MRVVGDKVICRAFNSAGDHYVVIGVRKEVFNFVFRYRYPFSRIGKRGNLFGNRINGNAAFNEFLD